MQNQVQYNTPTNQSIPQQGQPPIGDRIDLLPSDSSIPSHNEIKIMDTLFKEKKSTISRLFTGIKEILVMGALFIIFSLPILDGIITRFIKLAESYPMLLGIKCLLFMFSYFLINNFYLSRK
jgi:hypothetical protein